ncbi:hypothetical protein CR513_54177, partial [Mucuna pruriens]
MTTIKDEIDQKHEEVKEEVTLMKSQIRQMMQLLQSMEARRHQDNIVPRPTRNTIIYPYGMLPHFEEEPHYQINENPQGETSHHQQANTTQTPEVSLENPWAHNHVGPSNLIQGQTLATIIRVERKGNDGA